MVPSLQGPLEQPPIWGDEKQIEATLSCRVSGLSLRGSYNPGQGL